MYWAMRGYAFYVGRDVHITGGSDGGDRTPRRQFELTGKTTGPHVSGEGADFTVDGLDFEMAATLAVVYRGFGQVELDLWRPHAHVGWIQDGTQPVRVFHVPANGPFNNYVDGLPGYAPGWF